MKTLITKQQEKEIIRLLENNITYEIKGNNLYIDLRTDDANELIDWESFNDKENDMLCSEFQKLEDKVIEEFEEDFLNTKKGKDIESLESLESGFQNGNCNDKWFSYIMEIK